MLIQLRHICAMLVGCVLSAAAMADSARIAVAANFTAPMRQIAERFEKDTGYTLQVAYGSTGQFYAQIKNGAPFDVFLAADQTRPVALEQDGYGVAGSRFTYAQGRLVLWSRQASVVKDERVLTVKDHRKLAIANPALAPYGLAAEQTMKYLGVWKELQSRLVMGTSVGQAFQFVSSGNALLGFVALSQVYSNAMIIEGSGWIVPAHYHDPIAQDAILLRAGRDSGAAKAFLEYLKTEPVKSIIHSYGYD
jgi:molybdate transport system substrate-binding protein